MTALREVSDEFILWSISGEDVGREIHLALQRVQSRQNSTAGLASRARCLQVHGSDLPRGPVHAVFATIDYGTWARGRHQSPNGPPIVRNSEFPWGLPSLHGNARSSIEQENQRLREVLRLLRHINTEYPEARIFFAFPEHLGATARGCPASPWTLRELRQWAAKEGWCRYALYQCELDDEHRRFPLGLLTSETFNSSRCHRGWPKLRKQDGKYVGPLPAECACSNAHSLATSSSDRHQSPQSAVRPGFFYWLWCKLLKVGPLRSGRPQKELLNADQLDSISSSGGETWLDSLTPSASSSATSRASSCSSSAPSNTSLLHRLNQDQQLADNLGLSDEAIAKDSVLNAKDINDQNYAYQVPTVKARAER